MGYAGYPETKFQENPTEDVVRRASQILIHQE